MYIHTYMYALSVGVVIGTTAHTSAYMVCACTYFMIVYRILVCVGFRGSLLPAPAAPGDGSGQGAPPQEETQEGRWVGTSCDSVCVCMCVCVCACMQPCVCACGVLYK